MASFLPDTAKATPPSPSHLPAWLTQSMKQIELFQVAAEETRTAIQELRDTCTRFDERKRKADEYMKERERLIAERLAQKGMRKIAKVETLPADIYGRLMLFLSAGDVLQWNVVSKALRAVFSEYDEECWQPWGSYRWKLVSNKDDGDAMTYSLACLARAAAFASVLDLLTEFRHGRIPENAGAGRDGWTNALTGLVFLASNCNDSITKQVVVDVGGVRFLLGLAKHNSHFFRRIALGVLANFLVSSTAVAGPNIRDILVAEIVDRNNGTGIARDCLCSPVAQVESSVSQEASRLLVNIFMEEHPVFASGSQILTLQNWSTNMAAISEYSPFADAMRWKLSSFYQSGSKKADETVFLHFFRGGRVVGEGIDGERGSWYIQGTWSSMVPQYTSMMDIAKEAGRRTGSETSVDRRLGATFEDHSSGNLSIDGDASSGSVSMSKYFGVDLESAMRNGSDVSYRGYWCRDDAETGFFGVWENSTGERYQDMRLHGGGIFRAVGLRDLATE